MPFGEADSIEPLVVLGFDYGEKKVGVAVGNNLTGLARPLTIIENRSCSWLFCTIQKLIQEWCPHRLIVGLPLHADGKEQQITLLARKFGRQLSGRFHLPVVFVDERYSSLEASLSVKSDLGKKRVLLDAESAKVILQQYFNEIALIE